MQKHLLKNNRRFLLVLAGFGLITYEVTQNSVFAAAKVLSWKNSYDSSYNSVILQLDQKYDYIPLINAEQGLIRVSLYNLQIQKPTQLENLSGGLSKISLSQNGKEALLEFYLKDILQSGVGLLDYEIGDKNIQFKIINVKYPPPITTSPPRLSDAEEVITSSVEKTKAVPIYENLARGRNLELLFYLVLLLAMALFLIKLYHSLLLRRQNLFKLKDQPKILNVYHLSAKQKIWILEINHLKYAVAVTPQSMQLISTMPDEYDSLLKDISQKEGASLAKIKVALLQQSVRKGKTLGSNENFKNLTNISSFKTELKKRLAKLKPVK